MKLKSKVLSIVSAVCVGACSMFSAKQSVNAMNIYRPIKCTVIKSSSLYGKLSNADFIGHLEHILSEDPSLQDLRDRFRYGRRLNLDFVDTACQEAYKPFRDLQLQSSDIVIALLYEKDGKIIGEEIAGEHFSRLKKILYVLVRDDDEPISIEEQKKIDGLEVLYMVYMGTLVNFHDLARFLMATANDSLGKE